ncbi:MAG: hypothetical protein U0359_13225 [Byssovorax sp.]
MTDETLNLYCPLPSIAHHEAEAIQAHSVQWALGVELIAPQDVPHWERQKIGWLAARCFPRGDRTAVEIAAAWITLHCLVDDIVEGATEDALAAVLDAMREGFNLERQHLTRRIHEPVARASADLRRQLLSVMTGARCDAFSRSVERLLGSFEEEAAFRKASGPATMEDLMRFREINVGVEPLLLLIEPIHGLRLGTLARSSADFKQIERAVCRIGALANDVVTFEDERRQAGAINAVAFVAEVEGSTWAQARRRVVELHNLEVKRFLAAVDALTSPGKVHDDGQLQYVETLQFFIRGHLDWTTQSRRHQPAA